MCTLLTLYPVVGVHIAVVCTTNATKINIKKSICHKCEDFIWVYTVSVLSNLNGDNSILGCNWQQHWQSTLLDVDTGSPKKM